MHRAIGKPCKELRTERRDVDKRIERLYEAIENGTVDLDGSLRKRLSRHQHTREELIRLTSIKERRLNAPLDEVTPGQIDKFGVALRKRLRDGPYAFRKTYLNQFIDCVEVGEQEIGISSPKDMLLEQASASIDNLVAGVRTFDQDWRALQDSNLRPTA